MEQTGFSRSSVRLRVHDIQPSNEDGAFLYLFRWLSASTPETQEMVRDNDADFPLTIPWEHLPEDGTFTLTLVIRCRDGGGDGPELVQTIKIETGTEERDAPDAPTEPGIVRGEVVPPTVVSADRGGLSATTLSHEGPIITDLLLSRRDRNLEAIRTIAEENAGLSGTKTFERTEALVSTSPAPPPEDLTRDFEVLIRTLLSAHNRAQPDRKVAYEALAKTAILALFDGIATQPLTDEGRDQARAQLAKLTAAGIDPRGLFEGAWLTEELERALDPERIERIRTLIE
jgi:hypothetical protein